MQGAFATIATIATKIENEKGCPIPTTEKEFAEDTKPVAIVMDSPILGRVPVTYDLNEPDSVLVDDVGYSHAEIKDLVGRGLQAEDLRAVHELKKTFDGQVMGRGHVDHRDFWPLNRNVNKSTHQFEISL